ncbi:hypothetical protein BOX15_Mlig021834g1 [Macrostomum lignano]|uniref:Uncharacterized protein n=2 Tax=Macrostomum lignano TaxID=282301 RepID=A0A267ETI2_9PLAT|nr:hypothetical protein BOX15_Mlig021834g2 [Macrostomum lignano]PAA64850.1 hypothetical protein BOX15_Mlig021834g1 [Macrostomum lignano]
MIPLLLLLLSGVALAAAIPAADYGGVPPELLEALSAASQLGGGGEVADFGVPPPPDPSHFRTPEDLKDYLDKLRLYYALVSLPRFGKRASRR